MQRKYSSMYGRLLFFICLLFIQDADMSCNNTDLDSCLCSNGYYGGECEMPCSQNCKSENGSVRCIRTTGICSNGCKHGWCYNNCTNPCSKNCRNSTCLIEKCWCDGCENGYHGDYCEKPCEKNCSRCDQENGHCIREPPIYTNISRCENPQNESTTEGNPVVNLWSFGCGWLSGVIISTVIFVVVRLVILDYIRCRKCRGKRDERDQTQDPRQQETQTINQQETQAQRQSETQNQNQPETQAQRQSETQALNQPERQEPSHEQRTQEHALRSLCKKHCKEHWVYYFVMSIACVIGLVLASCGYRT
ncbi:scavenger receptor class F member 2-like [Haliotis rubra]|uniref:scavenger receptor class F member 2-like n=1 Tax=Haliotis rubra TaxID=36100 RepID=UPI001EE53318|nr:scavenger receptor class F member 2-like [Haliotis rubra]XP_046548219.1 scavenger receptor class F member 2-like [Haliotis rubra]